MICFLIPIILNLLWYYHNSIILVIISCNHLIILGYLALLYTIITLLPAQMQLFFKNSFHILSSIKIIIGIIVLILVGLYIDPFQDPQTWIIIWSIGLLFLCRWVSYFIFYLYGVKRTDQKLRSIASYSYKSSLLIALYILMHIIFIIIEFRSIFHAILLTLLFIWLYRLLLYWPKPNKHMSIDMIEQSPSSSSHS